MLVRGSLRVPSLIVSIMLTSHNASSVTTSDTFTPFLELQITFTPSKEKAVLYYFQALQMQKRLGVSVEHDRIDVMLLEGTVSCMR